MIPDLAAWQWALTGTSGFFVGMAKTGVAGLGLIFVPIMAFVYGARASTGVLLPMLSMGDVFGVSYYRRHADVKHLFRLVPWTLIGLGLGIWLGASLPDALFKKLMGALVLVLVVLMFWQENRKDKESVPTGWWFHALAGTAAGFATMVGNAAGPVMSLYLISMRLPKNAFIGTSAWFFLAINAVKIPLQIIFWKNIDLSTLTIDLMALPFIAAGAFVGLKVVGKIPEKWYKPFILVTTALTAVFLLL
ncbi:MAG: sulfite exporter TauE/SafE family protein [Spirochaetales bacterium]